MEEYQLVKLNPELDFFTLNAIEAKFLYEEIFLDSVYSNNGIVLKEKDCIIDVGANQGMFALYIHKQLSNYKLFCIEPVPETFNVLSKNTMKHGINAVLLNTGLSDTISSKTISYYNTVTSIASMNPALTSFKNNFGLATIFIKSFWNELILVTNFSSMISTTLHTIFNLKIRKAKIKLVPFSNIIEEHKIKKINLLKIDVEGNEIEVLAGISDNDWEKIEQIVMELHQFAIGKEGLERIETLLASKGFKSIMEDNAECLKKALSSYFGFSKESLTNISFGEHSIYSLYATKT
jgi:FkbM family methyltransferase